MIEDAITLENTVWSGCSIKNNEVIGVVVAVGKNTRLEKNSASNKNIKTTHVDKKINQFSIVLFLMMMSVGVINAIIVGNFRFYYFIITLTRFTVLLSFMIPISVKLFIMLGRFGFS